MFSIDGHTMIVIEADGHDTEPYEVDTIQIFAAQRYSFVVRHSLIPGVVTLISYERDDDSLKPTSQ